MDGLIDSGHPIQRIDDYQEWLNRFETSLRALRALPEWPAARRGAATPVCLPPSRQADPWLGIPAKGFHCRRSSREYRSR